MDNLTEPPRGPTATLRACVATRTRRWLVAVTILTGLAIPILLTNTLAPQQQTFALITSPTQAVMSVFVPCVGVLLAKDLRRSPGASRASRTLPTVVAAAAAVGAFGSASSALAVLITPSTAAWDNAAITAVGGPLLQSSAVLVGTGLGLLLRPSPVACLSTVVLPLGAWLLLEWADLGSAQAWLTPYGASQNLLSGMSIGLAQWLVVAVLWSGGLNLLGAFRLRSVGPRG